MKGNIKSKAPSDPLAEFWRDSFDELLQTYRANAVIVQILCHVLSLSAFTILKINVKRCTVSESKILKLGLPAKVVKRVTLSWNIGVQ